MATYWLCDMGEPQALCVVWFSQTYSKDNYGPTLVELLGSRGLSVPGMVLKVGSGDSWGR